MISDCLLGVEELIARYPPLLARLNDPPIANPELAKEQRISFDYYEAGDDDEPERPYFVIQEADVNYSVMNLDELQGVVAVDVTYSEETLDPSDHKVSKVYFLNFVSGLLDWIGSKQGKNISDQNQEIYITVHRIQMLQMATRSVRHRRDPDRDSTDYFWCKWRMWIGEPEAV